MVAILGLASVLGFFVSLGMLAVAIFKKTSKKKSLINLVVCFVVFLVAVSFPTDTSEQQSNANQSESSEVVELTDEEQAQAELDKATAEFLNGDYMSAVDICNTIVETYPTTEIATNMDSYLREQYSAYPAYTAKELMSFYGENVVNADKEYTGAVMVVSGTVSSIGKTNSDRNLTVMLESGTYFYGVQLNFKTSQEDVVAALREGDSVKVVGKCTGQSGTILLVVDAQNVMIENCLII